MTETLTAPRRYAAPIAWSLFRVRGELDLWSAPALDRALRGEVSSDHSEHHVVVDLAGVTFLDCSGVRPLVAARRRLGRQFWLCAPSAPAERLLRLVGLDREFTVLDVPPATPPAWASTHDCPVAPAWSSGLP